MTTQLATFRAQYDPGCDLSFDGVRFRAGAPFSVSHDGTPTVFGLSEGYRMVSGQLHWGFVRFHLGTDRAPGPVVVPFSCERTRLEDDGGMVYGSLLRMICDSWGFEVRVAHMDPKADIHPEVLEAVLQHAPLPAGRDLGVAGHYGISSGASADASRHTHTEIVSIGKTCPLLDELLELRWPTEGMREYEAGEILAAHQDRAMYRYVTPQVIWDAWAQERKAKGITWASRFRAVFAQDRHSGHEVTRYSSALLFNGM